MLSILKSALNANTKEMGIVSNNIANVNSTAFKKSKTNFEHMYSRDRSSSPSKFSGQGVGVNDPLLQMSQGSLKTTNGALDLAVIGSGFFQVVSENFLITPNGRISSKNSIIIVIGSNHQNEGPKILNCLVIQSPTGHIIKGKFSDKSWLKNKMEVSKIDQNNILTRNKCQVS